MDPIQSIKPQKDSSFAILLEAQRRKYQLYYIEANDLFIEAGHAKALVTRLEVRDEQQNWFTLSNEKIIELQELDIIFMRKDPPFNMEYIYLTYILELAEQQGVRIINKPQSLRDANEKIFATHFPTLIPPHLVSKQKNKILKFIQQNRDVILKPIDGMGGQQIFLTHHNDVNQDVIIDSLTQFGSQTIMAQQFIPEIREGDKRILLINGEPVPYALNRIPGQNSIRGNMAAGGKAIGIDLTQRDRDICLQLKPILQQKGLFLVGIDIIGDYLTEINVTSPTGIRQLDQQYGINIAGMIFDNIVC